MPKAIWNGVIALIHAGGFETLTHQSSALIGAGFGVIHAIIGGLFMGMMPTPGTFMSNLGIMGVMART